jgi:osmotically-inducible protein OsmY
VSLRRVAALALALAPLAGCELAVIGAATTAAYSVAEDRRTSGTQLEDESIQLRAQSRINERFGEKAHVTVTSYDRVVLLTGEVPDEKGRDEIGRIVAAVPNVRSVANELQLGAPSSRASRLRDEVITTKIRARLVDSSRVSFVHVKVVTEVGVVYLMGQVTEAEADHAVEIARTTGGVVKVVKLFDYCKPTDEVCRPRRGTAESTRPAG